MTEILDHLILGCSDLGRGIAHLEKLSGYKAALGGSHPGRGTRNALLKIGRTSYLEILAPDPAQSELAWHKEIRTLFEPLLVGYAIRQKSLEQFAATLRRKGIRCQGPIAGSRRRPDGQLLSWKTLSYVDDRDGLLPFYIDWDERSAHPATDAPGSIALISCARSGHLVEESTPPPGTRLVSMPEKPVELRARLRGAQGEFELLSRAIASEAWLPTS